MKAILQVGPAQFFIEGATFHLLCVDIRQTLAAIVKLQECSISLKLHVNKLETRLAEDARRLRAAGVALPGDDDDDDDPILGSSLLSRVGAASRSSWQRRAYIKSTAPMPRYVCPTTGQRQPVLHRRPLFIFSAASFDAAEAVVQRLQARLLEQHLLLDEIELQALCSGGDGCSVSDAPTRVLPLPIMELDTYLSTSANVMPAYDVEGNRRRCFMTVVGASANGRHRSCVLGRGELVACGDARECTCEEHPLCTCVGHT
ncbi:hypothetical protein LMJF_21_0450 [Leishmania major strain Friedlin]|uniref:Uncharacterized protein n=1 Tax=Leishmania major TaxID=5664 RepID=Q4QCH0_LEIMA|nr:hypothetical protein LMJF_21_0450 [Leishmania major strain Friedlin]CAG9573317.1 hypothetical_protein_-_conserved [Leishmania major strain Friedlin]CAJ03996.1 hypothetical protein LMJF_21_0450 [Leishmania major strain Friedlin]|eukprot:XP_001682978.1 hypothetical protein LMJF_21_0450 [Leishmania major strain Friedlin]